MKKLLTLVTMICMMIVLPTLSFAEAILQDEQPPMLVARTNASGETTYAVIRDAQGNEVLEIRDENSLVLVDVHGRNTMEEGISKVRLISSYLGVMDDVHHSDVECLLHEHDVKVDINDVLASLGMDIDAHELVMYELFDISFTDDITAHLTEGCTVEMRLEAHPKVGTPLIALFSSDGTNWQVIPTVHESSAYTVAVPSAGTIALLCDGTKYLGIGSSEQYTIETTTEGTEDTPGNFTPSVSGKPSPDLVTGVNSTGEAIIGYIRNDNNDEEITVPDRNYVLITSVAERDYIIDIQTHEHLEWAYDSILAVADVGDLMSDNHEGNIASALDGVLQQMGLDLSHDQLVVKDLFEVTAYGDYLHYLYDEDFYLELTFDPGIEPEKNLLVIRSKDSEHWHVHANENVIRNADGTVTLRLYDLGAVAFLVEEEYDIDPAGAVQAP